MMKYVTYGLAVIPSILAPEAVSTLSHTPPTTDDIQRVVASLKPSDKGAKAIAKAIRRCAQSKNIPWKDLLAVAMAESSLNPKAIRKVQGRSVDFGLFQINVKTLKHYRLDKEKMTDVDYNTDAACKVISDIRKVRKNWHGYYNVGPYSKNNQKRTAYESKIQTKVKVINRVLAQRTSK